MLELENAQKYYTSPGGDVRAVDDLSVAVGARELVAVYGPSGSGKTTLLLLAAGLLRADSGSVRFEGMDLGTLPKREVLEYRRTKLGFVFQNSTSSRDSAPRRTLRFRCSSGALIVMMLLSGRAAALTTLDCWPAPATHRPSSPVESSSASRSRERSWGNPASYLPMSQRATWTARRATRYSIC